MRDWDAQYIKEVRRAAIELSTCLRRQVAAILVIDKRPRSRGYNGSAKGTPHCLEFGCVRDRDNIPSGQQLEHCRGGHAEIGALSGIPMWETQGATLYCTTMPCSICATMIVNVGIRRVVYCDGYGHGLGRDILSSGGVEIVHWQGEEE